MLRYVLRRLLLAIPTMLTIITLAFFLIRSVDGGPLDRERQLPPEIEANLKKMYHLDEPLPLQYARYLGHIVRGDLGPSFHYVDKDVNQLIGENFPASIELGLSALTLALLVGPLLGIVAARHQNSRTDYSIMAVAMVGITIPNFVIAPLLTLLFGVHLHWLPTGGWGEKPSQMVLPVFCLALPYIAYLARLMRGSMIEALHANPVRTARAKGVPERQVVLRHCLKGALLPVLSAVGPMVAGILTGSVVIEMIFTLPGLGKYFVSSALHRDYTLVMGVVIFYGFLIILMNLIVDVLYGLLDPKVRLS